MMFEGAPPGAPIIDHDPDAQQLEEFLDNSSSSSSYTITTATNVKHVHTWRVHNFSLLPFNKHEPVESLKFSVGRGDFVMRLFPNGRAHESNDRVSVFIKLVGFHEKDESALPAGSQASSSFSHPLADAASAAPDSPSSPALPGFPLNSPSSLAAGGPKVNTRYRFRYVFPSGERDKDEVIPVSTKPWYHYKFSLTEEHEGAYVTKPALEERGFLKNDCLVIQAEIEVIMQPVTFLSFSHSLPFVDVRRGHALLGADLSAVWKEQNSCDVFFRIKSQPEEVNISTDGSSSACTLVGLDSSADDLIPAHRFVISARSKIFSAMFQHAMKENSDKIIEIDDIDRPTLLRLLYHFYTGELPCLTNKHQTSEPHEPTPVKFRDEENSDQLAKNSIPSVISWSSRDVSSIMPAFECPPLVDWFDAVRLFKAASKYSVDYLCELCGWKIAEGITVNNVLLILQFAEFFVSTPGHSFIKSSAKNFLLRRFDEVLKSTVKQNDAKYIKFFEKFMNIASQPALSALASLQENTTSSPPSKELIKSSSSSTAITSNNNNNATSSTIKIGDPVDIIPIDSTDLLSSNNSNELIRLANGILIQTDGKLGNSKIPPNHYLILIKNINKTDSNAEEFDSNGFSSPFDQEIHPLNAGSMMFIPKSQIIKSRTHDSSVAAANFSDSDSLADSHLEESLESENSESRPANKRIRTATTHAPASAPPAKRIHRPSNSPNSASPTNNSAITPTAIGQSSKRKRTTYR